MGKVYLAGLLSIVEFTVPEGVVTAGATGASPGNASSG